jgi:hypothetical protein
LLWKLFCKAKPKVAHPCNSKEIIVPHDSEPLCIKSLSHGAFPLKIDPGFDGSAGVQHVCDFQQGQLGDANAYGV